MFNLTDLIQTITQESSDEQYEIDSRYFIERGDSVVAILPDGDVYAGKVTGFEYSEFCASDSDTGWRITINHRDACPVTVDSTCVWPRDEYLREVTQ